MKGQSTDQYNVGYSSEMHMNMNVRTHGASLGGVSSEPMGAKVINSTARTECSDSVGENANVLKAFGVSPKSNMRSQPNAIGNVAVEHLFKSGKKGPVKGGITYK